MSLWYGDVWHSVGGIVSSVHQFALRDGTANNN